MNKANLLELANISKSFPGVKALDNISIDFKKGEVHSIIGENGAGKSTLVKILARIIKEDSGNIIYCEKRITTENSIDLQKMGIQFIFQDRVFFDNLSILENFYRREIEKNHFFIRWEKILNEYKGLLDRYGLKISLLEKVGNLSTGQKQFLEILRAFNLDAKLIVLDEPTASLTDKEIKILYELIKNIKNKLYAHLL